MQQRLDRILHLARSAAQDPGYAARRLLRRRTTSLEPYEPAGLDAGARAELTALSRSAQKSFPDRGLLFVFGIMPRSGTNFVQDLLCQFEGVARPVPQLDEISLLSASDYFAGANRAVFRYHPSSGEALPDLAWMAFAAGGLRNHLLETGRPGLTVLKEPRVVGVDLFPALFPLDRCLIVFRSGKHVVDSYMRTFASGAFSRTFEDVCAEVAVATEKALALCEMLPGNMVRAVRYEDAAADRAASAADILAWAGHAARLPEGSDLNAMPVLGSSTHSKGEGGKVSWTPRKAEEGFNPAARPVKWSAAQESAFERICGAANRRAGYQ